MQEKCYIIQRSRFASLYLTPFEDAKLSAKWVVESPITWYSSTNLTSQEKDRALYTLYSQIDRGVDRWVVDARYVPRLLISAAVFLIVYFFFALAIRDPIPVIDELVLGLAAAIGTGVFLSWRDKNSDMAVRRRLELKQAALRSEFALLEGLEQLEDYLADMLRFETLDLADQLTLTKKSELKVLEIGEGGEWVGEVHQMLKHHVELSSPKLYDWYKKLTLVHQRGVGDEVLAARLVKAAMRKDIDLPLLALMVALDLL